MGPRARKTAAPGGSAAAGRGYVPPAGPGPSVFPDTVLWDVDGTLLDFLPAERAAIRACFSLFGLGECSDAMIARYSRINSEYWARLERGELTKPQVLTGRFREFFRAEGLPLDRVEEFNAEYQLRLGDTICFLDDSRGLVRALRGRVRQYIVTNGTAAAQSRKLSRSGLGELVDGVFISDLVGYEKPSKEFFLRVFDAIAPVDPARTIIVGDSLTGDMRGGQNAGILTCWYNPGGKENTLGIHIDHEIRSLRELPPLLGCPAERPGT